jgi:hypothetical protein
VQICDANGDPLNHATIKFYDDQGTELTTQVDIDANCVKTVLDWEPPWDYEIIGGQFRQQALPPGNIYLGVIAVPDVPAAGGGSIEFVNGVNLKSVGLEDSVRSDGRTSKKLAYDATYHTNKLRFILRHDAGVQHTMDIMMEIFRA